MKFWVFAAVLCILFFTGCEKVSEQQPPPRSESMQEKEIAPPGTVSTFKAAVSQESFEIIKHKTTGRVYYKYPDKMRIELTMLDPHSQLVIIYTPDVLWEYDPEHNTAERTDLAQLKAEFEDLVPSHLTGYIISDVSRPFAPTHRYQEFQFEYVRNEELGGEETRVFEAVNKNPKGKEIQRITVWVGDTDGFLRQKVKYLLGKKDLVELFYNVEVNSDIPDSLFQFTPPQGAKVTDRTEAYRNKLLKEDDLKKRLER